MVAIAQGRPASAVVSLPSRRKGDYGPLGGLLYEIKRKIPPLIVDIRHFYSTEVVFGDRQTGLSEPVILSRRVFQSSVKSRSVHGVKI